MLPNSENKFAPNLFLLCRLILPARGARIASELRAQVVFVVQCELKIIEFQSYAKDKNMTHFKAEYGYITLKVYSL